MPVEHRATGTTTRASDVIQMRAVPTDESQFYKVVQQLCTSMYIAGYRVATSFYSPDQSHLVFVFQR